MKKIVRLVIYVPIYFKLVHQYSLWILCFLEFSQKKETYVRLRYFDAIKEAYIT